MTATNGCDTTATVVLAYLAGDLDCVLDFTSTLTYDQLGLLENCRYLLLCNHVSQPQKSMNCKEMRLYVISREGKPSSRYIQQGCGGKGSVPENVSCTSYVSLQVESRDQ